MMILYRPVLAIWPHSVSTGLQGLCRCQLPGQTEWQKVLLSAAAFSSRAAECSTLSLCTSSSSDLPLLLAFQEKPLPKRCTALCYLAALGPRDVWPWLWRGHE